MRELNRSTDRTEGNNHRWICSTQYGRGVRVLSTAVLGDPSGIVLAMLFRDFGPGICTGKKAIPANNTINPT